MVIVDTNIIIDHLRTKSNLSILEQIRKRNKQEALAISLITVQELYEGKSTQDKNEEMRLASVLGQLKIISYSLETAIQAGKLKRDSLFPMTFPDAAIAATAILHDARLATFNIKDFKEIDELKLLDL